MPLISVTDYRPPLLFRNPHFHTIYPTLFRKVEVDYQRERVQTPDGDFLDLDWSTVGGARLVIVLHGLEGSAAGAYIKGMIRYFNRRGWDGLGFNFRGCSGTPNRKLKTYHMAAYEDIDWLVNFLIERDQYRNIALVGFSLGGNVLMNYFGRMGAAIPEPVDGAVALSTPCYIPTANERLRRWDNRLYTYRFERELNRKKAEKLKQFPGQLPVGAERYAGFFDFDNWYTAPAHGFENARDYWERASGRQYIPGIRKPFLLINAGDDTFLSPECYPEQEAHSLENFYLCMPPYGGHAGFYLPNQRGEYWSEQKTFEFLRSVSRGLA